LVPLYFAATGAAAGALLALASDGRPDTLAVGFAIIGAGWGLGHRR
jgi:hypothetical protein